MPAASTTDRRAIASPIFTYTEADRGLIPAWRNEVDTAFWQVRLTFDVLVNKAASYPSGDALAIEPALFHEALQVNALAPWHVVPELAPRMAARGFGRIVNVSSGGILTNWVALLAKLARTTEVNGRFIANLLKDHMGVYGAAWQSSMGTAVTAADVNQHLGDYAQPGKVCYARA